MIMVLKILYYPQGNSKNKRGEGFSQEGFSQVPEWLHGWLRSEKGLFIQVYSGSGIPYHICMFSWSQSKKIQAILLQSLLYWQMNQGKYIVNCPRPRVEDVFINLRDLQEKSKSRKMKRRMTEMASHHKTWALIQHFP